MVFNCKSELELDDVAEKVIEIANNFKFKTAFVVGLYGDLGSGKTTFIKRLAKKLNILEIVTSPTFVLQKKFEIQNPSDIFSGREYKNIYHLDVYRVESEEEMSSLRWFETINNSENIVLVEWANLIENVLPEKILKLEFSVVDENTRRVEIIE